MKKKTLLSLKKKTLRGLEKCNDIISALNQECCDMPGQDARDFRGITCYHCEVLDTTIENLKRDIGAKQ